MQGRSSNRLTDRDLYVDREAHPDWPTGAERIPQVGEEVFCVEGMGEVVKVLGKTGDGSRLLELRVSPDPKAKPFYAAASNVLVPPKQAA